jgi:CHAT domain
VAKLQLNADCVVLSASETIAGEKAGAEALSGFARAFFYAGARALLLTHWNLCFAAPVSRTLDDAAVEVTLPTESNAENYIVISIT